MSANELLGSKRELAGEFSFAELERRVAAYVGSGTPRLAATSAERRALGAAFAGALVGFLGASFVPGAYGAWIGLLGLFVEVLGFVVWVSMSFGRDLRNLRLSRAQFAADIDADFVDYSGIVAWLRRQRLPDLELRLSFLCASKQRMSQKIGLLTGGLNRLGVLPVVAAVYFQVKDVSLADFGSITPPTFAGGLVGVSVIGLYVLGWWATAMVLRMDLYEALLSQALDSK